MFHQQQEEGIPPLNNDQFTYNKDTATTIKQETNRSRLELDNAYLKQQNEHLNKELSFTRYTINALKNITHQRDATLNETRLELERALQHIQLLTFTLRQQQRRLSGIDNDLASTSTSCSSSSDDDQFEEEEVTTTNYPLVTTGSRPTMDIMSKLPLRGSGGGQHSNVMNEIFIQNY